MKSQNELILAYLRKGGTLDPMKALRLFCCWALSSRIAEIVGKSGHVKMLAKNESIARIPAHNKSTGKRYMQYRLIKAVRNAKQKD